MILMREYKRKSGITIYGTRLIRERMKRPQTAALGLESSSNRSARVWTKLYPRQPLQDQPGDDADGCAAGDAGEDKHREVGKHFKIRY